MSTLKTTPSVVYIVDARVAGILLEHLEERIPRFVATRRGGQISTTARRVGSSAVLGSPRRVNVSLQKARHGDEPQRREPHDIRDASHDDDGKMTERRNPDAKYRVKPREHAGDRGGYRQPLGPSVVLHDEMRRLKHDVHQFIAGTGCGTRAESTS